MFHLFFYANLKYLNPMPKNTGEVLSKFNRILIPELNMGQLSKIIKSEFLIPVESLNKVKGLPFKSSEIKEKILKMLGEKNVK